MNFINNYAEQVELAEGETVLGLDLPDGEYRLTLSDARGAEATAFEYVGGQVVDGIATLERGLEGSADREWPAGSWIYCSVTAGVLNELLAQIDAKGWAPDNFVQRLEQGEAGQGDLFWSAAGVGAYARVDLGRAFGSAQSALVAVSGSLRVADGYLSASGAGDGAAVRRLTDRLEMSTGTTASGSISLVLDPRGVVAFTEPVVFARAGISGAEAAIELSIPDAATAAQDFELGVDIGLPGVGYLSITQARDSNSGNLSVSYFSDDVTVTVNTSYALASAVLAVIIEGGEVEIAVRPVWGSTSKTTIATFPLADVDYEAVPLTAAVFLNKLAGATARTVTVRRYAAYVRLK